MPNIPRPSLAPETRSRANPTEPAGRTPKWHTMPPLALHVFAAVAAAAWLAHSANGLGAPNVWAAWWIAALLLSLATPWKPVASLGAYLLLAYGTPRYGTIHETFFALHVLDWSVVLALTGLIAWRARNAAFSRHWLLFAMFAFVGWVFISALFALGAGLPWHPLPEHHPIGFLHALILSWLAAMALRGPTDAWQLALFAGLAVMINALTQGSGIYLEGDISFLSAIVLPLVILGAWIAPNWPTRIGLIIGAGGLLYIALLAQNRAAAVGAAAALLVALWHFRQRWRMLAIGLPVLIVALAIITPQNYVDRFRALWNHETRHATASLDRATAEERLLLWNAGWQMARDKPWAGVGIGNYPQVVVLYLPRKYQGMVTHNGPLQIAAETGFPGLILYGAMFLGTFATLRKIARRAKESWRRSTAIAIQAALAAYLAAGLFISRHDLVLAYILVGWAAALWIPEYAKPALANDARKNRGEK